jgi:hypothetical protein
MKGVRMEIEGWKRLKFVLARLYDVDRVLNRDEQRELANTLLGIMLATTPFNENKT